MKVIINSYGIPNLPDIEVEDVTPEGAANAYLKVVDKLKDNISPRTEEKETKED